MIHLSIIIPTYNDITLDETINSLEEQFYNRDYFQVIVVGSYQKTKIQESDLVFFYHSDVPFSPAEARSHGAVPYVNHAIWVSNLLKDEHLLWLSALSLKYFKENPQFIKGQHGVEGRLNITKHSPSIRSCMVYGNSGLLTQSNRLDPDKIVFRSGWDHIYMLLNRRFTGLHRYKAIIVQVQVYQNQPLLVENYTNETFNWLPIGRSLYQDKQIPFENLNRLLIGGTGLSAVLYQLTGIGDPWLHDPSKYAQLTRLETKSELSISSTLIDNWDGWQHQRTIYINPVGIVGVFDHAYGYQDHPIALSWHFVSKQTFDDNCRISLGQSTAKRSNPKVVLLPIDNSHPEFKSITFIRNLLKLQTVLVDSEKDGDLQSVTVFLFDTWRGANVIISNHKLVLVGLKQINIPIPE